MKSLTLLFERMLFDISIHCGTDTSLDVLTLKRRVEHEGLSFLTITLGEYAQDFERSLEIGLIDPLAFRSFGKRGLIPRFLSGIIGQVFNTDGTLLDEPSITAIRSIRQVCRMCKKVELPCSEERTKASMEGYIKLEDELSSIDPASKDPALYEQFLKVSDILWSSVLGPLTEKLVNFEHIPKHGTGKVADSSVLPNQKYYWTSWHSRLEQYFPMDLFCYHSIEAFIEESDQIVVLDPDLEPSVRIVQVPKTLKGPRIIGIEPACMQYTQQSLLPLIVDSIESKRLTAGRINFSDQTVNRIACLESSRSGNLATLDLSEASDRVLASVVYDMLRSVPILRDAIFACRSTTSSLLGQTIRLKKFASMGSALCFPIEAMVFYTIILARRTLETGHRLSGDYLFYQGNLLYVYGDDILIPVDEVPTTLIDFETFGLKVSKHKSFWNGKFRESCGMDAYNGYDVSVTYIRDLLPESRRHASRLASSCSLHDKLLDGGYYASAKFVEDTIKKVFPDIPYVVQGASSLGLVNPEKGVTIHKRCEYLHKPLVKGYVLVPKKQIDVVGDHAALMKWFLQKLNPLKDHWKYSVRPGSLTVKRRWTSAIR
jgi:hypothetical protein